MPKISVILTSYNHGRYIKEAIDSILNQTYTDFELIIVDDCSTDNSWNIIESYKDERIIKIRHPNNIRKCLTSNLLNNVQGEYIAIHHSDDVWEPTKLEKQVAFLEANPQYAACFTKVEFIDENSTIYELPKGHFYKDIFEQENRTKEEWLNHFFYKGNCLCHPSILIRKKAYKKYGLLDTVGLAQLADFVQWIRLCLHEEIFIYQERLTKFRLRRGFQENTSADKSEVHIRIPIEMYYVLQQYRQINNNEFLIRVFPEAKEYIADNKINIDFVLAKLAQKVMNPVYHLLSISLLFELINDSISALEINKSYNYTYKDFIEDTAKYDIFGIKRQQKYMNSTLYINYGNGFNETDKIAKKIYIRNDGSFFIDYEVQDVRTIHGLRFDPNEGELLKIAIDKIMVNNQSVTFTANNSSFIQDGYSIFYTLDPQFSIDYCGEGKIRVAVSGMIDYSDNLIGKLVAEKEKWHRKRDNAYRLRGILSNIYHKFFK